jgi:fibronectin-binding autotransporter adhesin
LISTNLHIQHQILEKMNPRQIITITFAAVAVLSALTSPAQILKSNNNVSLDQPGSWVPNTAPGPADLAVWDATVATPDNCTNTLAAPVSWGGILISNPTAAVDIVGGSSGISIGSLGITLTNTADLWLAPALTATADQTWNVGPGRTLTLGEASRDITINNSVNVTLNGAVAFSYEINDAGTLTIPDGSSLICAVANAHQSLNVGTALGAGVVDQTGGTVIVGRTDGTTGSPKSSLIIAYGGVYDISGGSLLDNTANEGGRFDIGTSSGAGTLNLDGTSSVECDAFYLANGGDGTVNVTNGTLTVSHNFRVGVNTGTATMNVYGGTVQSVSTMNLPNSSSPGILNLYGGAVNVNGLNLANGGGPGTATVNGGVLMVTNSLALARSTGNAILNLNGGTTIASSLTHAGNGAATLNWDGGTLKPAGSSTTFLADGITVNVMAGGAVVDTTNYNITFLAPLLDAGGGGLTKFGSGTLTIGSAPGTYSGPTVVNAGTLALTTTNHAGGPIVVDNNAGLQVTLANATTMNCSALSLGTLGSSLGGTNTLNFLLGSGGNPTIPVINTSSLTATGTVLVTVSGSGFTIGTIHLIQYSGAVAGADFDFELNRVSGAVGYVTNNAASQSVDLVITDLPRLAWRAAVDTNWDIDTTANWEDLGSGLPSTYPDGAAVSFDDNASNTVVNLTNTVNPAAVTLNNVASNYVFSGGGRIAGATSLTKTGAGTVTMGLANGYNGATVISNGTFVLGIPNAIPGGGGRGNVTLEGKLDLAGFDDSINGLNGNNGLVDNSSPNPVLFSIGGGGGVGVFAGVITNSGGGALTLNVTGGSQQLLSRNGYTGSTTNRGDLQLAYEQSISPAPLTLRGGSLYWVDSADHGLANQVTLNGSSAIGASTNGLTTFSNVVNIAASVGLTCNSDVLFAQGATNEPGTGLTGKSGPGTLTLNDAMGDWSSGTFQLNAGIVVFNGGTVIEDGGNFRIQCNVPDGLAYCIITNGATIILSNNAGANVRVGDSGDATGATNIMDVAGTLTLIPQVPGGNNGFELDGANSALDIANLLPGGVIETRFVSKPKAVPGIFNFNGGTLRANTNDAASTFMQGLTAAYVDDGGAIIDDGGFDITIGQALLAGGSGTGGLTKQGAGRLTLTAQNTYTGDTLIEAGTLAFGANFFPPSAGSIANSPNIVVSTGAAFDVSNVVANLGSYDLVSGQTLRGKGTVIGTVTVDDGATVAPGDFNSTGALTFSNAPVLSGNSTVRMRLDKGGGAMNDQLAVASADALNYNGALVVTNVGGAAASGDAFYLFSAPGGYSGVFNSVTLPPLADGLGWDMSALAVNGSLVVTGAVVVAGSPGFSSVALKDGNLIFSGTNGSAGAGYRVLSSTNVALPLGQWTPVATNHFNGSGNFSFTNMVDPTEPEQFFNISVP